MLALERRNLILEKLQEDKKVVVSLLSRQFGVSEETIRRDLEKLEADGFAIKSYGGAVLNENSNVDMPFGIRKNKNVSAKQKIAELAAKLVDDDDQIMLDASTTAVFIARALKQKSRLTVVTNSIEVLLELADISGWNVISTGGKLKEGYLALLGYNAQVGVERYCADKLFLSCKGLDIFRGFMDSQEAFAQVKQSMLRSAREIYLVVDNSKFEQGAFCKIGDFGILSGIITDREPEQEWQEFFREQGIRCYYPR